jgi:type II secretory pathway component PulC
VARPPQANGDASVSHEQALDPQQLAVLAKKPLRVPFSSSTPPPAEETDPVPMDPDPMLNVTLRGTILERGYSVAVFETPESPVELRGVGELVGDEGDEAEVVEIYRDHVVLRYQGQLVTLPFPAGDGL